MELRTYNGEYFERSVWWYTIFAIIVGVVVVASAMYGNIIGSVIILLFVGGYLFIFTKTNEHITIKIEEN
jgi:Na+/citrate or Na+/malate symporter